MVYVYDAYGGVGLSEAFYGKRVEVLTKVKALVEGCTCKEDSGCPACIQSPRCWGDRPLSKKQALAILKALGV